MKRKKILLAILSVLSISLFPCFFLLFINVGTVVVSEALTSFAILTIMGLFLFGIMSVIFREVNKAALLTNIILLFFNNFYFIEKGLVRIFPSLYYWHVLLICVFIIIQTGIFIQERVNSYQCLQLVLGMSIIFSGLILFNGIRSIPDWIRLMNSSKKEKYQVEVIQQNSISPIISKSSPNFYYFIFDEYGGYNNLLRYCNYDNSDFYESLEELGFNISINSTNGTIDTYTEIPNILQLQIVNKLEMTAVEKMQNFQDPQLLITMKDYGYHINAIDATNSKYIDFDYVDIGFSNSFASSYRTFASYIFLKTALYPFWGKDDQNLEISQMESMFDYAESSSTISESNLFTIGYFVFPHIPYIVDEFGNRTSTVDRNDLKNPEPYLSQLKYANKKILELVMEIISNDPNSIIVIQSDHGYRLPSHLHYWYGLSDYDLLVESPYERNILNVVYYQNKNIEIEELSGLETMRLVLRNLLGIHFIDNN